MSTPQTKPDNTRQIRERFLMLLFEEISVYGFCPDAWILMEELESAGRISIKNTVKTRLYQAQLNKHFKQLDKEVLQRRQGGYQSREVERESQSLKHSVARGDKVITVQNRCRSIVVCNYLKKYLSSFDVFKASVETLHDGFGS